jgi:hypothetical protein
VTIAGLVSKWRDEAATFRRWKVEHLAVVIERAADDLEAHLRNSAHDPVTLKEASEIGGYRYDHLSELVREGVIENMGRKGKPLIRRMDIPVKPGCGGQEDSVPVLRVENGRSHGLEEGLERGRVRVQRGGDAP